MPRDPSGNRLAWFAAALLSLFSAAIRVLDPAMSPPECQDGAAAAGAKPPLRLKRPSLWPTEGSPFSVAGIALIFIFVFMFPPSPLFLPPQSSACHCTAGLTFAPQYPIPGEEVRFTGATTLQSCDSGTAIIGFEWDFGDGRRSTMPNQVHAYASAGTYTVRRIVTLDNGKTCTEEKQITVSEGGVCECTADFTFASENQTHGREVRFTDQSSLGRYCPAGTAMHWAWDFTSDGTVDSSQQNPVYTYTDNGTHSATLTVTCNGSVSARTKAVTLGDDAPVFPSPSITTPTTDPQITLLEDTYPQSVQSNDTSEIQGATNTTGGDPLEGADLILPTPGGTFNSSAESGIENITDSSG